jgi:hypothetical protein
MTELADLGPLASRLNDATDELNQALESIQQRLNDLALGVEVWLTDTDHALERSWSDQWNDGVDATFNVNRRWCNVQELGYGRLGDSWALLVRNMAYLQEMSPIGVWEWADGESETVRKPLLRAARHLRVKAVAFLTPLVEELHRKSTEVIDAVEQAKRIAESIK